MSINQLANPNAGWMSGSYRSTREAWGKGHVLISEQKRCVPLPCRIFRHHHTAVPYYLLPHSQQCPCCSAWIPEWRYMEQDHSQPAMNIKPDWEITLRWYKPPRLGDHFVTAHILAYADWYIPEEIILCLYLLSSYGHLSLKVLSHVSFSFFSYKFAILCIVNRLLWG